MAADTTYRVEFQGVDRGLKQTAQDAAAALNQASAGADKAKESLGGLAQEGAKAAGVFQDANGRWRDANGRFLKGAESATGFGASIKNMTMATLAADLATKALNAGLNTVSNTIGAVNNLFNESIALFVDFEAAMAQAAAATGGTIANRLANMQEMAVLAKTAAATSKFSAMDAAKGMDDFARAGFSVVQMQEVLTPTLNFATANVLKLNDATRIATQSKAAFNVTAEEMPFLLDQISNAATLARTDVDKLADAASRSAGSLKTLGNTDQDILALNAALIEKTGSAELAGTALRGIAQRLTKIGDDSKAGRAFAALGIQLKDLEGNARPIFDILDDLRTGLEQFEPLDPERLKLATEAFGEFGKNAIQLTEVGTPKLREMANTIAAATGENKRMADMMQSTAQGQMQIMSGQIETLKTELGEGFNPILKLVAGEMGKFVNTLTSNTQVFNSMITGVAGFGHAFAALLPVFAWVGEKIIGIGEFAATLGLRIEQLTLNMKMFFSGGDLSPEQFRRLREIKDEVAEIEKGANVLRNSWANATTSMVNGIDGAIAGVNKLRKDTETLADVVEKVDLSKAFASAPEWMQGTDLFKKLHARNKEARDAAAKAREEENKLWESEMAARSQAGLADYEPKKPRRPSKTAEEREKARKKAAEQAKKDFEELNKAHAEGVAWFQKEEIARMRIATLQEGITKQEKARMESAIKLKEIENDTKLTDAEREFKILQEKIRLEDEITKIKEKQTKETEKQLDKVAKDAEKRWKKEEEAAKKAAAAEKKRAEDINKAWEARKNVVAETGNIAQQVGELMGVSERNMAYLNGSIEAAKAVAAFAAGVGTGNPAQFVAAAKHGLASAMFFKAASKSGGGGGGATGGGGGGGGSSRAQQRSRVDIDRERRENAKAITEALMEERNARQNQNMVINLNSPTVVGTPEGARQMVKMLDPELRRIIAQGRS